eukprot:15441574-Alexandrium_andersonii.AAC.1
MDDACGPCCWKGGHDRLSLMLTRPRTSGHAAPDPAMKLHATNSVEDLVVTHVADEEVKRERPVVAHAADESANVLVVAQVQVRKTSGTLTLTRWPTWPSLAK